MNWKKFLIVSINLVCLALPYNMIGCAGGDDDPYDYYVSFYNKQITDAKGFEPFYYTNTQFLYKEKETIDFGASTAAEWVTYSNNAFSTADAKAFMTQYARKDLSNLYFDLEKNQTPQVPDSVSRNGMTKFFSTGKDFEALGYVLYAKQVEPNVTGDWTAWEPISRDKDKMGKLIKNGQQLHAAAKNNFIKLRLAYQVLRLAHYSGRYQECIQFYDELVKPNTTQSMLQDQCLSLKAGSLLRLGQRNEAAYLFSQLFSKSEVKRISNYMSFDWSVKRFDENNRKAVLALCKTDLEKANLLGLFALGSNRNELNTLKRIQQMAPTSPLLEILVIREMNKLEEYYFTPTLRFQQNKNQSVTINYNQIDPTDSSYLASKREANEFAGFLQQAAKQKATPNKALYSLSAAHALLITGDYPASRKWLDDTKKLTLPSKLEDQWGMTNLLWTINTKDNLDGKFEEQLFPSLQWLERKALADPEYGIFYRRVFANILAPRYEANEQTKIKALLCDGVASHIQQKYVIGSWGYYGDPFSRLRYDLTAEQVEQLIQFMESSKLNVFEKYIVSHNSFSKDDVNDVAGTSWLRQFNFAAAEKWFRKIPAAYYKKEPYTYYLAANPFADLILDSHEPTKQDTVKYTRLTFAQKMQQLEKAAGAATDNEKKARLYYELAKGYYHMSYWGNSWMLTQYSWSSGDGLSEGKTYTPAQREYYGVYKAEEYYQKAFDLSSDKNFKARALFMVSKCDQKQIPVPAYDGKTPYQSYEQQQKVYQRKMMVNKPVWTTLVKEYSTTPFYKEAYNTCSYLVDFAWTLKK